MDYRDCTYQTVLGPEHIHGLPSAHNVWSLIENQDLSATVNRIDVGGLWGTIPALFSARGGTSWTQSVYLLNGFDVSDPFQTGLPLLIPDFYSLRFTQMENASPSPEALSPGGQFNMITKDGSDTFHGGVSVFTIHSKLQSSNISEALRREGLQESHAFNHALDGNVQISGPLIPGKLTFFSSLTGYHVSRNIADYLEDDLSSLFSGLFSLKLRTEDSTLRVLWTGQTVSHPSFGAGRSVPYEATSQRKETYNVFQSIWEKRLSQRLHLTAGITVAQGATRTDFQSSSGPQHGKDVFSRIPAGAAPLAGKSLRTLWSVLMKGEGLWTPFPRTRHSLAFGVRLQGASSSASERVKKSLHRHFLDGVPLEVVRYIPFSEHRETAIHLSGFVQSSWSLADSFSFMFGLHIASTRGWIPGSSSFRRPSIDWLTLSPRVGLVVPLTISGRTALKLSAGRYHFTLPLHYLTYGNPDAPGAEVFRWEDTNQDLLFQEGEAGTLLRKEGPFFAAIDPELKRPYVEEFAASLEHSFGRDWHLSLGFFTRRTRNLVETINIGVPFSAYVPRNFSDTGDDRIPGTQDDLKFTVYEQKKETLGQDFFLLTNETPERRRSVYYGGDLTLVKKMGKTFMFFLSLTATSAVGVTNPGNTHQENDEGVIGRLYDDPNTLINAEGRVAFDRAYTGRVGFSYRAPLGVRIGCLIKYYDGQPFARKIIVPGLAQGPFYIHAHPRGKARYEYNRTVDIRLEKIFSLSKGRLRVILDGFNVLNRGLATAENEWTGPEFPLRFATEIQSPRVFRLGVVYEF